MTFVNLDLMLQPGQSTDYPTSQLKAELSCWSHLVVIDEVTDGACIDFLKYIVAPCGTFVLYRPQKY